MWPAETSAGLYVHRVVKGDAIHPGANLRFAAKGGERVMNFQKNLLGHVFGFSGKSLAQNRESQAKDVVAMAVE